ncbi:hypothetical protein BFG51_17150 [Dietzia alimentaria]|jgi:hypothetical protein|uniref:DUF3180 domain-containing protein n=1 Tax=Dietzia TaxID=37914 RepID=UPI0008489EFB|nr:MULTISPECIES: DUF3180 domain-containing protein [Dietzia]ODQ85331.1 hypothetical protein BFG51_17150 [Dietzia alimentaria]HBD22637.1 DUF3180 domain-containing protein [Dietzia sp.]MCZ4539042.1 DUF3180 domain-containing protein [Dietzia maris]MCZ4654698.1 DUF3180 domain-containing protein [Dietzia kunjamensis]MDJ0421461.1 DUF3180 domain-containing protein [Dietzia kunjamensis]
MTRVAKSTLVLVALVAAVAAYVLTGSYLGAVTPIGFGWVTLVAIAVVDVLLSLRIRAAISDGGVGQDRSQMHPLTIARSAALGQASAVLGAAGAGAGAGLTLYFLSRLGDLAVAGAELPASVAVLVSGAVLVAAGLFLESACETPPDDDENGGLADPA